MKYGKMACSGYTTESPSVNMVYIAMLQLDKLLKYSLRHTRSILETCNAVKSPQSMG